MAEVISVAMQKGGVAKSTSTANLAAVLVQYGKKVLVIDIDPQANLSYALGINPITAEGKSVYNFLFEDEIDYSDLIKETKSGIDIIFSHENLYAAEMKFYRLMSEGYTIADLTFKLKEKLQPIRDDYDYIFIDCPPSLGMLTINAFIASDSVLIPLGCDIFSLTGLRLLLENIERTKKGNPGLKVKGIFGTLFDARTNLSAEVMQKVRQIGERAGIKVYNTTISKCVKHAEAPGRGLPSVLVFEKNELVQQYRTLAKEVFDLE
ncbi:chromosome partitioning protein (plasmid) [Carboxydocella thermautotrophica]|nr:chromosome partitioning protein [Carboxydocella thermautotrophica]